VECHRQDTGDGGDMGRPAVAVVAAATDLRDEEATAKQEVEHTDLPVGAEGMGHHLVDMVDRKEAVAVHLQDINTSETGRTE
jgi:hypothetical protein